MTGSRKSTVTSKSVILFHGDKGGVGKSWTCSIFLDWLVKCKLPVTLVDGDTRNPDVSRMFSDLMPTLNANLRIHDGWMDLTDFMMKSVRSIHPSCIRRFALSVGIRSENMRDTSGFRVSPSTKVTGNLHFTSQSRNMEHVQLFPTPPLSPWKRMTDFEVTVDFLEPVILVYPLVSMTN